jgi:hypothetical protein
VALVEDERAVARQAPLEEPPVERRVARQAGRPAQLAPRVAVQPQPMSKRNRSADAGTRTPDRRVRKTPRC